MSNGRDSLDDGRADGLSSVEQMARLDTFLDQLMDDRRPPPGQLTSQEAQERQLAAQLRLLQEDVDTITSEFLQELERTIARAMAPESLQHHRRGMSRWRFLRTAATLAGGAGLGVAAGDGLSAVQNMRGPDALVAEGTDRWYAIATVGEVPLGGAKPFSAGGVLGFLLNTDGRLHAVSAI